MKGNQIKREETEKGCEDGDDGEEEEWRVTTNQKRRGEVRSKRSEKSVTKKKKKYIKAI